MKEKSKAIATKKQKEFFDKLLEKTPNKKYSNDMLGEWPSNYDPGTERNPYEMDSKELCNDSPLIYPQKKCSCFNEDGPNNDDLTINFASKRIKVKDLIKALENFDSDLIVRIGAEMTDIIKEFAEEAEKYLEK